MILLVLTFYIFVAIFEAHYFDLQRRSKLVYKDVHVILTFVRLPVWLMLGIYSGWWYAFAAVLMFPMVHDGVYYVVRHSLHKSLFKNGFFDYSHEDTAFLTFKFNLRAIMFTCGTILYLWASLK